MRGRKELLRTLLFQELEQAFNLPPIRAIEVNHQRGIIQIIHDPPESPEVSPGAQIPESQSDRPDGFPILGIHHSVDNRDGYEMQSLRDLGWIEYTTTNKNGTASLFWLYPDNRTDWTDNSLLESAQRRVSELQGPVKFCRPAHNIHPAGFHATNVIHD